MSFIIRFLQDNFGNPNVLWFLLVVPPVLALFFWWRERVRQQLLGDRKSVV